MSSGANFVIPLRAPAECAVPMRRLHAAGNQLQTVKCCSERSRWSRAAPEPAVSFTQGKASEIVKAKEELLDSLELGNINALKESCAQG